ncbi:MAG: type II toxin-antitoxin system VapC family toxin [Rectinemataceae bacterium]
MRVYLDACSLNRPFDDQSSLFISLQTQAKLAILESIRAGSLELVWSYILDYENEANPFEERRMYLASWRSFATEDVVESESILTWAAELSNKGLGAKDALHLACAREAGCAFFITADRHILKEGSFGPLRIADPVSFLTEGEA